MEQAQDAPAIRPRRGGKKVGRFNRSEDQKALIVAVAQSTPGGAAEAARLLEIPTRTVQLYVQQAKAAELRGECDFTQACAVKRDELGSFGYDLSGGAMRRLAARLEQDQLSERGLLSLAGLGWNIGKEAFGHGVQAQPTVAVQVNVSAGEALERLAQLVAKVEE